MIVFKCCVYRLLDYEVFRGVLFFFQFVAISTSATFRTKLSQISFRLLRLKCATSVSGASFLYGSNCSSSLHFRTRDCKLLPSLLTVSKISRCYARFHPVRGVEYILGSFFVGVQVSFCRLEGGSKNNFL